MAEAKHVADESATLILRPAKPTSICVKDDGLVGHALNAGDCVNAILTVCGLRHLSIQIRIRKWMKVLWLFASFDED
jgi:hypothetical protein